MGPLGNPSRAGQCEQQVSSVMPSGTFWKLWLTRADSRCKVGSEARNTCEKQVMEDLYVTVDRAALSGGHFVRAFARG